MKEALKDYLGDGLYVEFDGHQFRLHTDRDEGTHEVFLDTHVLQSFLAFVARVKREMDKP